MKNTRDIKRRIKSINNTQQITKAMEMVAASKMRKAQEYALRSRPYADKLVDILSNLSNVIGTKVYEHPLLAQRKGSRDGIVLITGDKGLCGGLNTNIFRFVAKEVLNIKGSPASQVQEEQIEIVERELEDDLEQMENQRAEVFVVSVGKKGRDFARRSGHTITAEFLQFEDYPSYEDVVPVAKVLIEDYIEAKFDRLQLVYTKFLSTLSQQPVSLQLLPVDPVHFGWHRQRAGQKLVISDYTFEPSAQGVFADLLPHFIEMQIYQALLEAKASEHSARMVAMRSASDNAGELIDDLVLSFNQARQAAITQELAEISSGAM